MCNWALGCNVCGIFEWWGRDDSKSGRAASDCGCGHTTAHGGHSESASNRAVVAPVVTMMMTFMPALATVRLQAMVFFVVIVVKSMQIRCRFVELHVYCTVRDVVDNADRQ